MITPKRHNTAEEYPIATLMQHLQNALTPAQRERIHWLLFALLALGTLAQTRVCLYLAQLTSIAPNTWRQRLKRFRQQPFPEQTLFPTLLRLVVAWLRLPQVFLALYQSRGRSLQFPPPLGSPRFARGTAIGAPTRFPLLAGGTLRKGFQFRLFL